MNVIRLRLENFKRFTDLTIDLSPFAGAPKLVLLIGANGSGKSSVFDAFEYLSAGHKESSSGLDLGELLDRKRKSGLEYSRYLKKDPSTDVSVSCSFGGNFEVRRSNDTPATTSPPDWDVKSAFYGRSSLRTIPELRGGRRTAGPIGADRDRPRRYIDQDTRFETDVSEMTRRIHDEVWGSRPRRRPTTSRPSIRFST